MSIALTIAQKLISLPPEVATLIMAMIPVAELRGAIPLGRTLYHLSAGSAFFWAVIGNMLPVYFILHWFDPIAAWLRKISPVADKFFTWLFDRTRRKLEHHVAKYGVFALALFVAVPLPVTGAWTGSLAASLFGFNRKQAFFSILVGVLIAGIIISILTAGGLAVIRK
ncbi:MAG: small multi-drug export protein [Candidatus Andersenbacteria bacterium]